MRSSIIREGLMTKIAPDPPGRSTSALENGERFAGVGSRLQELREFVQARRRPLSAVQPFGHRVERPRQAPDLVVAMDDGALGELPGLQGFGGLHDGLERQQKAAREVEGEGRSDQRRCGQPGDEDRACLARIAFDRDGDGSGHEGQRSAEISRRCESRCADAVLT
jgi:hypothetical protein